MPASRGPDVTTETGVELFARNGRIPVEILDLSAIGARLKCRESLFCDEGDTVILLLDDLPGLAARIDWAFDDTISLAFAEPLHSTVVGAIREIFPSLTKVRFAATV